MIQICWAQIVHTATWEAISGSHLVLLLYFRSHFRMPRFKHSCPQMSEIHGKLEDQFLNFISDHIPVKCLVIRYVKPTLGDRVPGYRLSAAVEDGGWLHTASHPQSPLFVCSGRSPQPPGHLHITTHGHSQQSVPSGTAEGREGPGRASGAVLGLMCVRNHNLTPRTHSSRATAMAAEMEETVSCAALRCLLSTSKRFAWMNSDNDILLFHRTKVLQLVIVPVLKLFTDSFPLFSVQAEDRPTVNWHVEHLLVPACVSLFRACLWLKDRQYLNCLKVLKRRKKLTFLDMNIITEIVVGSFFTRCPHIFKPFCYSNNLSKT